jgi:predicted RNase H-like nuclease
VSHSSHRAGAVRAVGIDACRGGWVAVVLDDGHFAEATAGASLAKLVRQFPQAAAIGVDMPLGLLERGWRDADLSAAKVLGHRRASVFAVPPRAVWREPSYEAAISRCRGLMDGVGMSRQAWGLRMKLLEANELYDQGDGRIHEVHPEVSFVAMGAPPTYSKKTWRGQAERRQLLAEHGVVLPDDLGDANPANLIPVDDVLDAAAAAWSAHRIAIRRASCLPTEPQQNERGQDLAIWF